MKNLKLLLLLAILVASSCKKENDFNNNQSLTEIPEVLINASLNGSVINEAGDPMENAIIRIGAKTTTTDVYGVFSFSNIEMNQNGTLVSAEKAGYFNNAKMVMTKANKTSATKIMLIEKVVTSTFVASAGGTSTMNGGAKVVIPANGVKLESGGTYSGNVNVYSTWLDPTASDLSLRMPGDLRGTNAANEAVKLETYGMIGVELEGDNGEPLNIADGQTATIEMPVPAALLGSAPSTIPLWHFDEATGYWVEDGEATLTSDNTYVGTVIHFSFWNCDYPYPIVHIEGTITNEGQLNVSGLVVEITLNSSGEVGYGYTDSSGDYEGYVPQDEELTISVYDNCGDEIYSGDIGPFSADAVVPVIVIDIASSNFLTVNGVLYDCDNNPESWGYVYLDFDGYPDFIDVNSDGSFNSTINVCDQLEVTVSGISLDPFSQGTTTVHDISGITELDLGSLITCW